MIVWDPPTTSTIRYGMYSKYKANRPPIDLDMKSQLTVVREALDAFGYMQVVSEPGYYEADDLIATLTKNVFKTQTCTILSRDKDLAQLIDIENRVSILDPVSGDHLLYDGVMEKYVGKKQISCSLCFIRKRHFTFSLSFLSFSHVVLSLSLSLSFSLSGTVYDLKISGMCLLWRVIAPTTSRAYQELE